MAISSNRFLIDNIDLFDTYGFVVSVGSDDFLKLPTRKAPPSHEWPDAKTEYDLSAPAFQFLEPILEGAIVATSEADFWNKYQSLWALLSAPGERILRVVELAQSYKVFYIANPTTQRLTRIKSGTQIIVKLSLKFQVTDFAGTFTPGNNGGFVNIINQAAVVIASVQAPGQYQVIQFAGIQDDGSGIYTNSIVNNQ